MSWLFSGFAPTQDGVKPTSAVHDDDDEGVWEDLDGRCMDEAKAAFKETCSVAAVKAYFSGKGKEPAGEGEIYHRLRKRVRVKWMASSRIP